MAELQRAMQGLPAQGKPLCLESVLQKSGKFRHGIIDWCLSFFSHFAIFNSSNNKIAECDLLRHEREFPCDSETKSKQTIKEASEGHNRDFQSDKENYCSEELRGLRKCMNFFYSEGI